MLIRAIMAMFLAVSGAAGCAAPAACDDQTDECPDPVEQGDRGY